MPNIIRRVVCMRAWLASMGALVVLVGLTESARGQAAVGGFFGTRVGGVSIDAAGMVSPADKSARIPMRDALRKMHAAPPAELNQKVEMRMVSLRRLEEAAQASKEA